MAAASSHWEIDPKALYKALDIVGSFPAGAAVFLSLEYVMSDSGPVLSIYATNRDYVFVSNIPIMNADAPDPGRVYFVKFQVFSSLVRIYSDFTFRFNERGDMYYHNEYVNYLVKTLELTGAELPNPPASGFDTKPLPFTKLALASAKKMVDYAVRIADNKVQWAGDRLSGFFLIYSFDFKLAAEAPAPIQFRKYDVSLMSALSALGDLSYAMTDDRFFVFCKSTVLSFSYLPGRPETKAVLKKAKIGTVSFSIDHLSKVLAFIRTEQALTSISFSPSKAKPGVEARIDGASTFYVGTGEIPAYGFSLSIEELRRIISVFPEGTLTVDCTVYGDGAEFSMSADGVDYVFRIGGIDTAKISVSYADAIDRLKTKKQQAKA